VYPARIWPKRAVSQWSQEGILIAGPKALKRENFAFKRLPARIWPKRAVSQWSQKGILSADPKALKWPKFASKRLPARIWPKRAVSQWSQEEHSIAGPKAFKWQKFASKGLLGFGPKRPFPNAPRRDFYCRHKGPQIAEICFQKIPGLPSFLHSFLHFFIPPSSSFHLFDSLINFDHPNHHGYCASASVATSSTRLQQSLRVAGEMIQ